MLCIHVICRYIATQISLQSCSAKRLPERPVSPGAQHRRHEHSIPSDFDDRVSKGLWRFLRQVVADTAVDVPVRIFARELIAIS